VAPEAIRTRVARVALAVLATAAAAAPAHALRLVNYNVTNYPSVLLAQRQPNFRTVLAPLGADVVACQEFQSQAGVDSFLTNVLNVIEPGQWAAAPFINGNDTDNALFYKPAKVQWLGGWAWYPPEPPSVTPNLRLVNCYRLKPVGYSDGSTELRIYSQHLKASNTSADANRRLYEATGIRDSMNAMPPGTRAILLGDFNIYSTTESAFQKLLEVQADNDGRLYDPLGLSGTFNQGAYALYHTQCPCVTCPAGSGFSGGGLDDRFDMFLPTLNLNTSQGLALLTPTYKPVGNDGLHWNLNINDPPTIPEGAAYASALWWASDHLPIRVDLQLPAKIALAPPALAFGSVIVGAAASQNLAVSNPATLPADALDYTLAAPVGFTAPGGSFAQAAGAVPASRTIGMGTASSGVKGGTLTVSSDAPDLAVSSVALSGTVLDHADASLDSLAALASGSLDFGAQGPGGFTPLLARVHDRGYNALQAKLAVSAGTITGGEGRFSIVGGFSAVTVAGTAASFQVQFDDSGATPDSTYEATLTFTSADEPLPGAQPQPDLTVLLSAHPAAGTTGTAAGIPTALRFYAPRPNPMTREAWFGFDLPRAAPVELEIFDLAGRRVTRLASGEHGAGRYELRWAGTNESGSRVKAGLYFARFATPGLSRVERVVRLP
jgi:hypothetical protein